MLNTYHPSSLLFFSIILFLHHRHPHLYCTFITIIIQHIFFLLITIYCSFFFVTNPPTATSSWSNVAPSLLLRFYFPLINTRSFFHHILHPSIAIFTFCCFIPPLLLILYFHLFVGSNYITELFHHFRRSSNSSSSCIITSRSLSLPSSLFPHDNHLQYRRSQVEEIKFAHELSNSTTRKLASI